VVSAGEILNASILVVDDQEADVSLLERMLRGAGYTSIASTMDPHEVCELQRKNRYCLILLDLQMPGMDGFQVMEGLKEIEKDAYLPVLVLTAQPGHKLRALQAGAKDFISKPIDLAEVLTRVYNMLEVRLLHMDLRRALDEVTTLRGLIPICAWCKKVRDDQGYWQQLEEFLSERTLATFTHSMCAECARNQPTS
jgi:CheY-like chemotaxis protein